ncbi:MAG TPA: hypothetical protein VIV57_25265 [Anaeromyxobacter sp.]
MRFGALLVATVLAAPARADVGPCDKLLEQGIRSYVSESTRNDYRRAAYESLCATLERASKDSTRDEAKRIFPEVVGEGEYDRVKLDGLRTAYCTLGKSLGANQRLYRKAAGTLRPRAVEAWRRCLDAAAGKYGPPIEIEQIDDYALSFTLRPAAHDLRSVRITMEGFDRCVGFVRGADPNGASVQLDIPVLARNKEHDLACFRRVAKKPPCGTEAAAPASLTIRFDGGNGRSFEHRFELARVMSWECPLPASP